MRVFVAGATGALGRPFVRELASRGHDALALSRTPATDALLEGLGATPVRADLFDAASLASAMRGADAAVRLATRIPTSQRRRDQDAAWAENDRVRREGTRAMLKAARDAGVPHFVQESIAWLARPDDGRPFDESAPPRPDAITASALDAEREAAGAQGVATATLRLGWVYGPSTAHTRQFADLLRKRRLPVLGRGEARLSFLHVDDAARAFADAVERRATGLFHVVDARPATVADLLDGLARVAGAPRPLRVPVWVGRLAAGTYVTRFLTTDMRTTSARFRDATGWAPRFATLEEGLQDVARAWAREGPLTPSARP